ncbi:MAG: hypothetical protein KDC92_13385 [Bacteroidetes bacterium]|nr:hypothetical protein [Bacteroidota bacterium]
MKFLRFAFITVLACLIAGWWGAHIARKSHQTRDMTALERFSQTALRFPHMLKVLVTGEAEDLSEPQNITKTPPNTKWLTTPQTVQDSGYLLFSTLNAEKQAVIRFIEMGSGKILHEWFPNMNLILNDLNRSKELIVEAFEKGELGVPLKNDRIARNKLAIELGNPLLLKDYSIVFNCGGLGHLYRLDKNSELIWRSEDLVHHGFEQDANGNIWACGVDLKNPLAKQYEYKDDAAICIDINTGKTLQNHSLTEIFKINNLLAEEIFSHAAAVKMFGNDPFHLNDVQPVLKTAKHWQKGDIFLSLPVQSMLVLYRPSTKKIIWKTTEGLCSVHDVDIVNDSTISAFNNNIAFGEVSIPMNQPANSDIVLYHFNSNLISTPYSEYLKTINFFTASQGRHEILENGSLFLDESNSGMLYKMNPAGDIIWQTYIPYADNETQVMSASWPRYYSKTNNGFTE